MQSLLLRWSWGRFSGLPRRQRWSRRKYLRFHFQGKAYEHKVLPFGLSLAPRTFTKCMDAALTPLRHQGVHIASYLDDWLICTPSEGQARSDTEVVLAHLCRLGLDLNREISCPIPSRMVTYLGLVLDSNVMRASLTPKRFSVCSHGSGMFQSHNINRRLHEGLGRSVPGLFSLGSVETLLERGSCEPTQVGGSASGVGELPAGVPGEAGPHQDRQFRSGFLYQPPGGYALSGASQRSSQASFVGVGSRNLLESGVPAREGQCGSRSSVQGRPPSREYRVGHLGPFRPGSGGPLCLPGDYSLPLVVFHDRSQGHIGGGCPSIHMAPRRSVRFPPLPSSTSSAGQSEDVSGQGASGGPRLASSALDGRASDNAGGDPLASPGQAGHALAGAGPAVPSKPRVLQAACLAPGRGPSSDLGAAVMRTLQAARAPSTRGLYAGR